jgi:hypothetical protein
MIYEIFTAALIMSHASIFLVASWITLKMEVAAVCADLAPFKPIYTAPYPNKTGLFTNTSLLQNIKLSYVLCSHKASSL